MNKQDEGKVKEKIESNTIALIRSLLDGEEVEEVTSTSVVLGIGEAIAGKLVAIEEAVDMKERPIKLIILATKEGLRNMALPTMLQRSMQYVQKDEEIAVLRIEDGETRDGANFKQFRVFRKKAKD